MNIHTTVRGAPELVAKFFATHIVLSELTGAATKAAIVVHKRVRDYPPQRPGTTYRRKGDAGGLKSGWEFEVRPFAQGVHSFVRNEVIPYAGYVQGAETQAAIHKGRWPTTRMILLEQRQKILGFYQAAVRNIKSRLGL